MVGIQYAQQLASLGCGAERHHQLRHLCCRDDDGLSRRREFLERYQKAAERDKVDSLGHFLPPFFYAGGQLIAAAAKAVGAIDEDKMAKWLHSNAIDTIVGPIKFRTRWQLGQSRIVWDQYRDIADNNLDQFRKPGKQIILQPRGPGDREIDVPLQQGKELTSPRQVRRRSRLRTTVETFQAIDA